MRLCVQAQKELLDAELDFHKRMSTGEDTTDLKRKLGQLQVEVMNAHTQFKSVLIIRFQYYTYKLTAQIRLVYSSSAAHPAADKDQPNGAPASHTSLGIVVFAVPPGY